MGSTSWWPRSAASFLSLGSHWKRSTSTATGASSRSVYQPRRPAAGRGHVADRPRRSLPRQWPADLRRRLGGRRRAPRSTAIGIRPRAFVRLLEQRFRRRRTSGSPLDRRRHRIGDGHAAGRALPRPDAVLVDRTPTLGACLRRAAGRDVGSTPCRSARPQVGRTPCRTGMRDILARSAFGALASLPLVPSTCVPPPAAQPCRVAAPASGAPVHHRTHARPTRTSCWPPPRWRSPVTGRPTRKRRPAAAGAARCAVRRGDPRRRVEVPPLAQADRRFFGADERTTPT